MQYIKEHKKYLALQSDGEEFLLLNIFEGADFSNIKISMKSLLSVKLVLEEFRIWNIKVHHSAWLLDFADQQIVLSPEARKPVSDKEKSVSFSSALYCKYKFKVFAYKYDVFKKIKHDIKERTLNLSKDDASALALKILQDGSQINKKNMCYNLLFNNCAEFMATNFFSFQNKKKPLFSQAYLFADKLEKLFSQYISTNPNA